MGLLSVLCLGFELARSFRQSNFAESLTDCSADILDRKLGKRDRIGAHVGNEADISLTGHLDAFIEPLRYPHRPLCIEAEFARCFLL